MTGPETADAGILAARAIRRVAAVKDADHQATIGVPELAEHGRKLAWLIRELNRAAHWAATGHDPGDGGTPHSCREGGDGDE